MSDLTRYVAPHPIEQALRDLIAAKGSPNTRAAYTADVERWFTYCRAMGAKPEAPTLQATTHFRDHLISSMAAPSARRVLSSLSSLYGKLLRLGRGLVSGNPFHPTVLSWPQVSNFGRTPAVSAEDAEAMFDACRRDPNRPYGLRDLAILRLLYDTGIRRSSVAGILREDIGPSTLLTRVKGGREVEVALPDQTYKAITAWTWEAPESPYVFPGNNGGHIGLSTINYIIKGRADEAGVEGVHPHCFRAAFITSAYDAGLPERDIQAAAHHADARTTQRYDRGRRGTGVAEAVAKQREKEK